VIWRCETISVCYGALTYLSIFELAVVFVSSQAEVFVLAYTEELLAAQEAGLSTSIKQTAKKHGVAGFTDVANDLEKVSEQKSVVDEAKGMTLTEISKTVEEINASINDRKVGVGR